MRLPRWMKVRSQRPTPTHVHITITADKAQIDEAVAVAVRRQARTSGRTLPRRPGTLR